MGVSGRSPPIDICARTPEIGHIRTEALFVAFGSQQAFKHFRCSQNFLLLKPTPNDLETNWMSMHSLRIIQSPIPFIHGISRLIRRVTLIPVLGYAANGKRERGVIQDIPDFGISRPSSINCTSATRMQREYSSLSRGDLPKRIIGHGRVSCNRRQKGIDLTA